MSAHLTNLPTQWSFTKKLFLVFLSFYLFLYIFPYPLNDLPYWDDIFPMYTNASDAVTIWIGRHLLGLESLTKVEIGSGDRTFDYVDIVANMLLSLLFTGVLLVFSRKQKNYLTLYRWAITYTRYYCAISLLIYGVPKLYDGGQFRFPTGIELDKTIGTMTPMGLLWNFMGFARPYTTFAGLCEITAGILLLYRRTIPLGCIIGIAAMANVVVMNFSFDVCVKLIAIHLLLFLLLLLAPNISRILHFLTSDQIKRVDVELNFTKNWMKTGYNVLKVLGIAAFMGIFVKYSTDRFSKAYGNLYNLDAINKVTTFVLNGDTLPPLTTDSVRWDKMVVESRFIKVVHMDKTSDYYKYKADTINKTMYLSEYYDSTKQYKITYDFGPDYAYSFSGVIRSDTISAQCINYKAKDFPLVYNGFHWIIE